MGRPPDRRICNVIWMPIQRLVVLHRWRRQPVTKPDDLTTDILHEARIVGLRSLNQPSIGGIERRRAEIWLLMGILIAVCGAAGATLSFWPSALPWFSTTAPKACFLALLLVAALHSAEKERNLRSLTRLLLAQP